MRTAKNVKRYESGKAEYGVLRDAVMRLWRDGGTPRTIAARLGVLTHYVRKTLYRQGVRSVRRAKR